MDQYSRVHAQLTTGMIFLMVISACSASRNQYTVQSNQSAPIQNQDVINVPPSDMVKDAIRLEGIILSELGKNGGWYRYSFQVIRVLKYGGTFSSVEPKADEVVVLNSSEKLTFESSQKIEVNVTTPKKRSESQLMIFKISE